MNFLEKFRVSCDDRMDYELEGLYFENMISCDPHYDFFALDIDIPFEQYSKRILSVVKTVQNILYQPQPSLYRTRSGLHVIFPNLIRRDNYVLCHRHIQEAFPQFRIICRGHYEITYDEMLIRVGRKYESPDIELIQRGDSGIVIDAHDYFVQQYCK